MARLACLAKTSLILILLLTSLALPAGAQEPEEAPSRSRWVREAGINLGYGTGETKEGHYDFVAVMPRVGLDLGEALGLVGLRPPGLFEAVFEPLVNVAFEPGVGVEVGLGLLFKYGYRIGPLLPFVEAGAGVVSMNDLVEEQAPGCNFIPQIGPGLQVFFTPSWSLTLAWRFRHLSDCGLSERNHGVNSDIFLVGASYVFEPEP